MQGDSLTIRGTGTLIHAKELYQYLSLVILAPELHKILLFCLFLPLFDGKLVILLPILSDPQGEPRKQKQIATIWKHLQMMKTDGRTLSAIVLSKKGTNLFSTWKPLFRTARPTPRTRLAPSLSASAWHTQHNF